MSRPAKRLGGLGLILGGLLLMLLLLLQPNPFGSERSYWAEMDSAQGLATTGRDIRVAGVNVGEIGSVERDGDGARIELVLPKDVSVHSDARVEMRPHLLFEGSSFVDLHLGSPSARALAPGAVIPRTQTSNYVTLDEALRILRPRIRRDVASLSKAAATTLRGEGIEGLQRTLRAAPALTASLTGAARALQGPRRRELASTIRSTARTVEALAARERDLAPVFDRLARTTAGLATDNGAPLDAALARLPGTLRALDGAAPVLTNTIDRLDSFSAHAAPSLPALARALAGTRPVLRRAIPVLRRGTPVVRDAHRLATALAKADALAEMLRLIPKPLGDLDGMLKQLLTEGPFGEPTYKQLGGTFAGFAGVFRSYQTAAQNPDGQGHVARGNGTLAPNLELQGFDALGQALTRQPERRLRRVPCDLVEQVAARAMRTLRKAGGCR